jgi:hypothetical protein
MQLADVKKGITDEDILALATDEANQPAVVWDLADLQVSQGAGLPALPCRLRYSTLDNHFITGSEVYR